MAYAFKCDICGRYKDGHPSVLAFSQRKTILVSDRYKPVEYEICGECHQQLNKCLEGIALANGYESDFNCSDNPS